MDLKTCIREIPSFPKPGILFKDITPLLKHPEAFAYVIDRMAGYCAGRQIDIVAGIEARGFLFAAPLAARLSKPLVPLRKEGKLPYHTHRESYALEYGEAALEVHTDAIPGGQPRPHRRRPPSHRRHPRRLRQARRRPPAPT